MRKRRVFCCDEKWSRGYRCKRREFSVILMQEEDEADECGGLADIETVVVEETPVPEPIQNEISLNSVVGISSPKIMKLLGVIEGHQVVVMIDPGATHNFISLETVKKLGLPLILSKGFEVSLGTWDDVQGEGECKPVVVHLQGITIIEAFLPLPLGNSDLILGVQWLETLGTVSTNWKTQTLKFRLGDKNVTLKGDPALGRSVISLKAMLKTIHKGRDGYMVECNHITAKREQQLIDSKSGHVPAYLKSVIQQHVQVFNMPKGLPPSRGHEHAINLKEGTNPVIVRPYHYPQSQKNEIESLICKLIYHVFHWVHCWDFASIV